MAGGKFLQRVSLEKAREAAVGCSRLSAPQQIATETALGRITADALFAKLPSPHYRASAMDGIAVRSEDISTASAETPVALREIPIDAEAPAIGDAVFVAVDTGNPLPAWTDTVVRIENTSAKDDHYLVNEALPAGRDVRAIGEDIEAGAMLFSAGHSIRPYDIGAMLAAGLETVAVRRKPTVAMLATGTEVIEPGEERTPGKVIEYNSRIMAAYVSEWGGEPVYLGRVRDDREALTEAIVGAARDHDIVAVIAGSSMGRRDFTVEVIADNGELLVHGVDMMPGKPASVALVEGKPVIGIPGYPVSAVVTYQQLLAPVIAAALGIAPSRPAQLEAEVRRKIPSRLGVEEFLRVCVARDGDGYVVAPLSRGAGSITTLVRADAILRVGANNEGVDAGTRVQLELLRPHCELEHSIVTAGKPDMFSSMLETATKKTLPGLRFAHVAAAPFDAVVAMERGEMELAIVELADKEAARKFTALVHDRLGGCTAYRVGPKGADRCRIIVVGRDLDTRECGRRVLSVLGGNTFALELRTIEEFADGVAVKRIAPT
jgi:putative molybdopterin biosynthesis protein